MAGATHWGWHRLADGWADRLVARAGVDAGDLVLDVGAGTGALSAALVRRGARVVAVELHPARAAELRRRFSRPPVTVVQADAADLRLPRQPFRVVANPPFAVTAALLRRLLQPGSRLLTADVVLPRHDAERWAALRARGAERWSAEFDVYVAGRLPPSAFIPRPPVETAVLRIERRAGRAHLGPSPARPPRARRDPDRRTGRGAAPPRRRRG